MSDPESYWAQFTRWENFVMALKWELGDRLRGRRGMGWGMVWTEFCDWATGGRHFYKYTNDVPPDGEPGWQCRICQVYISRATVEELERERRGVAFTTETQTGSNNETVTFPWEKP